MKHHHVVLGVLLMLVFRNAASADPVLRTHINPAVIYAEAIQAMPDRSTQDSLFTNEWRGRTLDAPFNTQVATYDNAFRLLREAARQTAPCDWGHDIAQGPELKLPNLAKAKTLAQVGRLRLRWHLENGRPEDAREDFLAAFVLARQVSRDGILISALVQIALENLLESGLAENWFRLKTETLQQITDGMAAAPARGTIAQCVPTERLAFKGWLTRRIGEIQTASRNEAEALKATRELLRSILVRGETSEDPAAPAPDAIIAAAGGTTAGLLRQLREMDAFYNEAATLMSAPYDQFRLGIKSFNARVTRQPNLLVRVFLPAFERSRLKEFAIETKESMIRAAVAMRLSGEAGLTRVPDPLFGVPFGYRRFEFDGVDRGFELKSPMTARDWPEVLIFLEKDGPAFHLDGPGAGQPVK